MLYEVITSIFYGDLELDLSKHRVLCEGKPVSLTASEYRLLATLMKAPGRVFSRNELLDVLHEDGEIA